MNAALGADRAVPPAPGRLARALEDAVRLAVHDHLVCIISDFAGAGARTLELQVELDLGRGAVRESLAQLFAGRLRDVADMLRRSGVSLLAADTERETTEQVRRLLGRERRR